MISRRAKKILKIFKNILKEEGRKKKALNFHSRKKLHSDVPKFQI